MTECDLVPIRFSPVKRRRVEGRLQWWNIASNGGVQNSPRQARTTSVCLCFGSERWCCAITRHIRLLLGSACQYQALFRVVAVCLNTS